MRLWQRIVDDLDHLVHRVLVFADRESADSEPGPVVHRSYRIGRFAPQTGVNSALYARKERLAIARILSREFLAWRLLVERLRLLASLRLAEAPGHHADAPFAPT